MASRSVKKWAAAGDSCSSGEEAAGDEATAAKLLPDSGTSLPLVPVGGTSGGGGALVMKPTASPLSITKKVDAQGNIHIYLDCTDLSALQKTLSSPDQKGQPLMVICPNPAEANSQAEKTAQKQETPRKQSEDLSQSDSPPVVKRGRGRPKGSTKSSKLAQEDDPEPEPSPPKKQETRGRKSNAFKKAQRERELSVSKARKRRHTESSEDESPRKKRPAQDADDWQPAPSVSKSKTKSGRVDELKTEALSFSPRVSNRTSTSPFKRKIKTEPEDDVSENIPAKKSPAKAKDKRQRKSGIPEKKATRIEETAVEDQEPGTTSRKELNTTSPVSEEKDTSTVVSGILGGLDMEVSEERIHSDDKDEQQEEPRDRSSQSEEERSGCYGREEVPSEGTHDRSGLEKEPNEGPSGQREPSGEQEGTNVVGDDSETTEENNRLDKGKTTQESDGNSAQKGENTEKEDNPSKVSEEEVKELKPVKRPVGRPKKKKENDSGDASKTPKTPRAKKVKKTEDTSASHTEEAQPTQSKDTEEEATLDGDSAAKETAQEPTTNGEGPAADEGTPEEFPEADLPFGAEIKEEKDASVKKKRGKYKKRTPKEPPENPSEPKSHTRPHGKRRTCSSYAPDSLAPLAEGTETSEASIPEQHPVDDWILRGVFLNQDHVFRLLLTTKTPLYDDIPPGIKENIYFTFDNSDNVRRRREGQKSIYHDDCGIWAYKMSSTKKTEFILEENKLIFVQKRFGLYCRKVRQSWFPLAVQPTPEDLIIQRRFYATLKRSPGYRKRITWFETYPGATEDLLNIAVAEYLGTYPEEICVHGNSKCTRVEYKRTEKSVLMKIAARCVGRKPSDVYQELVQQGTIPRDIKQVYNVKYNAERNVSDDDELEEYEKLMQRHFEQRLKNQKARRESALNTDSQFIVQEASYDEQEETSNILEEHVVLHGDDMLEEEAAHVLQQIQETAHVLQQQEQQQQQQKAEEGTIHIIPEGVEAMNFQDQQVAYTCLEQSSDGTGPLVYVIQQDPSGTSTNEEPVYVIQQQVAAPETEIDTKPEEDAPVMYVQEGQEQTVYVDEDQMALLTVENQTSGEVKIEEGVEQTVYIDEESSVVKLESDPEGKLVGEEIQGSAAPDEVQSVLDILTSEQVPTTTEGSVIMYSE